MKLSLRVSVLAGTLAALTLTAHAQSPIARASVPFEFAAGGTMLPPGDYTITMADVAGVILLQSSAGQSVLLFTTLSGETSRPASRFIFERRAGMPYLSAVEWPDQSAYVITPFKSIVKGLAATASR